MIVEETVCRESSARAVSAGVSTVPLACVELDRFCTGCGYNLRTLPVHRDQATDILLIRCTECGKFQPANDATTVARPWLHRISGIFLGVWMLVLTVVFIQLNVLQGVISFGTLEELTTWREIDGSTTSASTAPRTITVNGMTIVYAGNVRIRGNTSYIPSPRENFSDYGFFMTLMISGSFLLAFIVSTGAVVVFPHWPRVAYAAVALSMPVIIGGIVTYGWSQGAPLLLGWGLRYTALHAGVQMLGGLTGAFIGRSAARLVVRVFLPPGVRPRLAYLWHADGKPYPRPV